MHTENNVAGIKFKSPRKMTELSSRLETELPTLEKKHSMTNSSMNLRKSTTCFNKAYQRFHEIHHQLRDIPLTTKKFKDFSYKDKYYDINRRTLRILYNLRRIDKHPYFGRCLACFWLQLRQMYQRLEGANGQGSSQPDQTATHPDSI